MPPLTTSGTKLLGSLLSPDAKLQVLIDDLAAWNQPVDGQPFGPFRRELSAKPGAIQIYDQALTLTADTEATLAIHPPDHQAAAFDGRAASPAGSFAELVVKGRLGASGSFNRSFNPLTLTLGLDARTSFDYRHLLPAPPAQSRFEALAAAVSRADLPERVARDLAGLKPGEYHEITVLASLDLDAEVAGGGEASVIAPLFGNAALPLKVHAEYTIRAALQLSLYERFRFAIGRLGTIDPRWVRVRIERERSRRLSLGARFALEVSYDLASGLEALLDEILERTPVQRAFGKLSEIQTAAGDLATADWATLRQRLAERAGEAVTELIDDRGWLDAVVESKAVRDLVQWSGKVVQFYDGIDERLGSLWDHFLARTGLGEGGKILPLLDRLAALPDDPRRLVDPDLLPLIEAIEILSGHTLEELLLDRGVAQEALDDVRNLARRAGGLLRNAPDGFLDWLRGYAQRTGVAGAAKWLAANATSAAAIKTAAEGWIQEIAARVAGKAIDRIEEITNADAAEIRKWAQTIEQAAAQPEQIVARLRQAIGRLRGKAGLSIALEIERTTREVALLDIELDPTAAANQEAISAGLAHRSIRDFLRALPVADPKGDLSATPDSALPYRIRECAFLSRRTRTASLGLLLPLIGWQHTSRRQVEDSALRIRTGDDGRVRRELVASGGGVLGWEGGKTLQTIGETRTAAIWLDVRAADAQTDPDAPFAAAPEFELRLTFNRDDAKAQAEELFALEALLRDLGFAGLETFSPTAVPAKSATRLAIEIRIPERAGRLVSNFFETFSFPLSEQKRRWAVDYLNGLYRAFDEHLLDENQVNAGGRSLPRGKVLSSALKAPEVQSKWLDDALGLGEFLATHTVRVEHGGTTDVQIARRDPNGLVNWMGSDAMFTSRFRYGKTLAPLQKARATFLGVAGGGASPAALGSLAADASRALAGIPPSAAIWENPMQGIWAVIARLSRLAGAELGEEASGIATLRWRDPLGAVNAPEAEADWPIENLRAWTLDPTRLVHRPGDPIFPLRD